MKMKIMRSLGGAERYAKFLRLNPQRKIGTGKKRKSSGGGRGGQPRDNRGRWK